MKKNLTLVFDCGATNVRAVAMNTSGQIEAMHSLPNATQSDPFFSGGLIWDVDEIWQKFVICVNQVVSNIDAKRIGAITITTFGVNGAPIDKNGNLLYPVISWQCQRTGPIMRDISKYIALEKLYSISGVNAFSFNTINVLIWLKENRPEILEQMEGWLFISSIFVHKLTGTLVNDTTMAGTSMFTDLKTRSFSDEILWLTGIPERFFELGEPGTIAGYLKTEIAVQLGLKERTPVVLAGHDTQFALIGSGVGENEVVLNSGTWEILMTRCQRADLSSGTLKAGLTNELDARSGLINTGSQWLASGVLEWLKQNFYSDALLSDKNIYEIMISEAETIDNTGDVAFSANFMNNAGSITGLSLHTHRAQIYRAALVALSKKTKESLELLQNAGKFKASSLIIAGGGSKNRLWNQIRANILGIPLKIVQQAETTVLGASLFAQTAIGNYKNIEEAVEKTCRNYNIVYPEK